MMRNRAAGIPTSAIRAGRRTRQRLERSRQAAEGLLEDAATEAEGPVLRLGVGVLVLEDAEAGERLAHAGAEQPEALQVRHDAREDHAAEHLRRRGGEHDLLHLLAAPAHRRGDLVAYEAKHNEGNGEDNRDGTDDNRSWNCGVEGPTDDPDIERLRSADELLSRVQIRNINEVADQKMTMGERVADLVARFGGRDVPLRYAIVEYDSPRKVVLEARRPGFVSKDTITVEPAGNGSAVHYDATLAFTGVGRLFDPVMQRIFNRVGARATIGMQAALN